MTRRRADGGDEGAATASDPAAPTRDIPERVDDVPEEVQAELDKEIAGALRQYLPDETVRLIAPRLRQIALSVEHRYEQSDVEAVGEVAQLFEQVAPGRGTELVDAFLEDYRSRTRRQDREQTAQHIVLYAGMGIAAVVSLCLIAGAVYALHLGHVGGAAVFLGAAVVSMIAGFIDASTRRRKADHREM